MFHQVFVCDSAPEDLKPEEPMDTSQLEQEFQVPIVIKQEEILLSTEETPSEPSFDYGSNVNEDVVLAMETSQPKEERKLSLDTIYTEPAPSIEQHLGSDAKLQTSFVKLTDVKFDKLLSHVMEDKVLLKDLENKFFMDSVDDIKKEEKDPDLGDPNVTYNLVEKIKPEVKTVKTEIVIKEELDSDSMNVEEEDTEDNLANENTEEENLVTSKKPLVRKGSKSALDPTLEFVEGTDCINGINKSLNLTQGVRHNMTKHSPMLYEMLVSKNKANTSAKRKQSVTVNQSKQKNKGSGRTSGDLNEGNKLLTRTCRRKKENISYQYVSDSDVEIEDLPRDNGFDDGSDWEVEYLNLQSSSKRSKSKVSVKNSFCDVSSSDSENPASDDLNLVDSDFIGHYLQPKPKTTAASTVDNTANLSKYTSAITTPDKNHTTWEKNPKQDSTDELNVPVEKSSSNTDSGFEFLLPSVKTGNDSETAKIKPKRIWNKPWMCDICGKFFREELYLESHKNRHNNNRPYKCKLCDKAFTSPWGLSGHNTTIHLKNHKKFLCSHCGEKFQFQEDMKVHEAKHSTPQGTELPKPFKCSTCGKAFESKLKMQRHSYRHFRDKRCRICHEVFGSNAPMRYHMEEVHGFKKEYKCPICEKIFGSRFNLRLHKKWTHSDKLNFFCDTCGKGFKQKHHIRQHMITHSDERPIPCPMCDETFKRKTHLKQHLAAFHEKKKR